MGLFSKRANKDDAKTGPVGKVTLGDGSTFDIAASIDCLGDSCPRPQLMTKKALKNASSEDVIEVLIDNPSSMEAIPPMLSELGATHLETIKGDRRWQVYVRKN